MWSVYLENRPMFVTATSVLGRVSRRAYYGPLAPLRARTLGRPRLPERRWVRIRNRMAGISSSELRLVHLESDARVAAMVAPHQPRYFLGREVVGEVIEVGPDTQFLRPGDRVAYQSDQCCETRGMEPPCHQCAVGNYALCDYRYLPGPQPIGGGWSDEMVLHERQVFLVPDSLTDEQAALLEPSAASIHAVMRRLPQPGEKALIIGGGAEGLLATQALHALAPDGTSITTVAQFPFQVEMATRLGAGHVIHEKNASAAVVRATSAQRYTGPGGGEMMVGGFDIVYDTIGSATTLRNALRWAREGGTVVLAAARPVPLTVDLTPIWFREVTLLGAWMHGTENAPNATGVSALGHQRGGRESAFQIAARLIRSRAVTPDRLITHRFPLREVRRALQTARHAQEHRAIKVMLDMRDPTGFDQPVSEVMSEEIYG